MSSGARRRGSAMLAALGVEATQPVQMTSSEQQQQPAEVLAVERTPSKGSRLPPITESPSRPPASTLIAADSPSTAIDTSHLPAESQLLITTFESMLTGRGLLRRRGERTTYQNLTTVVERMTGKTFKLVHIQQIKHLYSEAFDWQYIRAPCADDPSKMEYQLLLSFDSLSGLAAGSSTPGDDSAAGRVRDGAARTIFKQRLVAWHEQHTSDTATADQPAPASASGISASAVPGAAVTSALVVPPAALPSKDNAPRIGGSPGAHRSLGGSLSRAASASSPTTSHTISHTSLAQQQPQQPLPVGLQLPPRSPAMSRLLSAGARAGLPPPSPTRSGRPLPSPSSQGVRPTNTSRGANSILDSLAGNAQQPTSTTASSPVPASPTAHHKRKAADAESPTTSAAPAGTPPPSHARSELRRRRLMLADSPDDKAQQPAQPRSQQPCAGDTPTKAELDGEDISPRIKARLLESALDQEAEEALVASKKKARTETAAGPEQGQGAGGVMAESPAISRGAGAGLPSPSARPRNTLLARFMSEDAMQELRRNSEAAPLSAAQAAEASRQHTTRLLPAAMDLLRAIYGQKGPVVKPKDEVVELMRQKSSVGSGMSSEEARSALDMMVGAVPEYASLETQGGVTMLRIHRAASIKSVRDKLKELATAGPTAVRDGGTQ